MLSYPGNIADCGLTIYTVLSVAEIFKQADSRTSPIPGVLRVSKKQMMLISRLLCLSRIRLKKSICICAMSSIEEDILRRRKELEVVLVNSLLWLSIRWPQEARSDPICGVLIRHRPIVERYIPLIPSIGLACAMTSACTVGQLVSLFSTSRVPFDKVFLPLSGRRKLSAHQIAMEKSKHRIAKLWWKRL